LIETEHDPVAGNEPSPVAACFQSMATGGLQDWFKWKAGSGGWSVDIRSANSCTDLLGSFGWESVRSALDSLNSETTPRGSFTLWAYESVRDSSWFLHSSCGLDVTVENTRKTDLGRRLDMLRRTIADTGRPFLSWEELDAELDERRGERLPGPSTWP
jgi:hypothetical protein